MGLHYEWGEGEQKAGALSISPRDTAIREGLKTDDRFHVNHKICFLIQLLSFRRRRRILKCVCGGGGTNEKYLVLREAKKEVGRKLHSGKLHIHFVSSYMHLALLPRV